MTKRKADTGKNKTRPSRCSSRLQEKEEEKRKMVEEVKITKLYDGITADNFYALYLNKKSIIIGCPEDRLQYKDNYPGYCIVLSRLLKTLIDFLSANTFNMLEKLTFEDVSVSAMNLQKVLRSCSTLPSLRSITIKRNSLHVRLFNAFAFEGPSVGIDNEGFDLYNHTYKLPGNSVLETISFEPGINESKEVDLMALHYFVEDNSLIKSIKVLNTEKHASQLSTDSRKKAFMQGTLDILSKRYWDKYDAKLKHLDAKLKQLDSVNDSSQKSQKKLYLHKLKASLLSHTVANSASRTGIFDKEVNHSLVYALVRPNANMLNTQCKYVE
jgi:hypothetical protein